MPIYVPPTTMRAHYKRRWCRLWQVEYSWVHTGYGTVVGWAWTKKQARRRAYKAVFELMTDDPNPISCDCGDYQ